MNTRAPELRALIIIFGSAGPVISTRRSSRSVGVGRHRPVTRPGLRRVGQQVQQAAGHERGPPFGSVGQEPPPARLECPGQPLHERERRRRQDLVRAGYRGSGRGDDLDRHQPPASRMSRWRTRAATARR